MQMCNTLANKAAKHEIFYEHMKLKAIFSIGEIDT